MPQDIPERIQGEKNGETPEGSFESRGIPDETPGGVLGENPVEIYKENAGSIAGRISESFFEYIPQKSVFGICERIPEGIAGGIL